MAQIKFGELIQEARGAQGGIIFSNSRSGPTSKGKKKPVRRGRNAQTRARATIGWISRQWGLLTAAQRTLWNEWSAVNLATNVFGDEYIASGYQSFLKLNMLNMLAYDSAALAMTEPPASAPTVTITELAASDGTSTGEIDLTPTVLGTGDAGDKLQSQIAGPYQSAGRVEVFSDFAGMINTAGDQTSETRAGLLVDSYYWFRMRYLTADNVPSNWIYAQHQAPTVA